MSDLLNSASLVLIPSGYKEDTVYSVVPSDGSGDLSFTRASNGTRVNSAGLVEVCPWNLVTYSNDFLNAAWLKSNINLTSGQTDKDGGTNAWKVDFAGSANSAYMFQELPAVQKTGAVWVKGTAGQTAYIGIRSSVASGALFTFNGSWQQVVETSTDLYFIFSNYGAGTATTFLMQYVQANIGSTAKPYFPTTDRLNVPRLTYQNGGGGCPSLLLEPQRTNLFPNSQTTANWSFSNMSRTANYGISPDGTQNADLLSPTTSGSVTFQSDITTSSLVIGQPFVVSFFIKLNASFTSDAGTNILDIRLSGPTVWSRPTVRVNLETGEVTSINNAIYISSTNFGNGWFRITFGATPTGTSGQVALQSPTSVTMNGGSFYIWGLQGEANATYATSYIPSQASSATRVADSFSRSNIYTNGLITSSGGTWFVELLNNVAYTRDSASGLEIANAGFTQRIIIFNAGGSSRLIVFLTTAGAVFTTTTDTVKLAIKWNGSNASVFANGTKVANNVTFTGLSMENLIGGQGVPFFISQMDLFPTPLIDAECIALTTI